MKSEGKKPFSRDKFIMVVMVGRRTSTQFFRSPVGSRSRVQDLGFAERMIFFKTSSEIRSKSVKKLLPDSTVKSALNLGAGCTKRRRLKLIIEDSKNAPKLSARVLEGIMFW